MTYPNPTKSSNKMTFFLVCVEKISNTGGDMLYTMFYNYLTTGHFLIALYIVANQRLQAARSGGPGIASPIIAPPGRQGTCAFRRASRVRAASCQAPPFAAPASRYARYRRPASRKACGDDWKSPKAAPRLAGQKYPAWPPFTDALSSLTSITSSLSPA